MASGAHRRNKSDTVIRAKGPLRAMELAELEWTDLGEPRSLRYGDCYFSAQDGSAETQHVFIEGSDLEQRLSQRSDSLFTIAELGFGTGLNFLMSWDCFNRFAAPNARLHFWSVDRHPLSREALERSLHRWPQLSALIEELLSVYPPPLPGVHRRVLAQGRLTLDLVWAEAADALAELSGLGKPLVDAWYLDGFAPRQNESMWTPDLYSHMVAASKPGATFATYSAAGTVRRSLTEAGFSITKRAGFGSKRECLHGVLPINTRLYTQAPRLTPWDLNDEKNSPDRQSALIVGAGLAGAHAAAALARRGMAVTVFDQASIAGGGSGNPQGVLFTRLSHERSILGEFSMLAFLYARELYLEMFRTGALTEDVDGALNGCVQIDAPRGNEATLETALRGLQEIAQSCDAETLSQILGVKNSTPGLWQPGSGWLSPPAVCKALLEQAGIRVHKHCTELQLSRAANGIWEVHSNGGRLLGAAPVVILATGPDSRNLPQTKNLPLRVVRGQTTQIPAPLDQPLLRSFCHRGYISPAVNGQHCIGATFKPGDDSREIRVEEHLANIESLAQALPAWQKHLNSLDPNTLQGRAELRCVSPDYLPLAGPLPDEQAFKQRYAALQWDASQLIVERGAYQPGLFVSTAHGSRGLSYAALSAELIAAQIFEEPIPVSRELQRAVAPARFLIRGLVRGTSQKKAVSA
ncbi:bifunctional tRNA (5-methylaminomethyl-2-thiouridine)(34)-methyltransferase MnmD/FAD-dependent 5-carboxymethylaminomethyl-2-thiouridine(34) oxidoreductase MnmC [Congregibacter variabilis]|uniref:tRNA 5-methylaminomethyl-2-thiouridine biosynthesis bifunctional protein MnmC n=1 Tax=Congregibacter variabilis TaxID=3081200 RepID=A0ABZ0I610_9GAMM|nr:bifunctional tRNA (5-methylaminomethyl-2-thiouridine)(34)-methyltransferase MnmD/FAD-dependent 5-carboxymethylaminomethyl-2-thiouridine(34) oxidoreductase MnmC [Congregibacter sp. IMCC43200]